MSKFKFGDKVRVINSTDIVYNNSTGLIYRYDKAPNYLVIFEGLNYQGFHEVNLELIKDESPTLRDQFAVATLKQRMSTCLPYDNEDRQKLVKEAYEYADAMLIEREKEK